MSSELRSVAAALEDVARWKAEEEKRQQAELAEVDQEVQSLKAAVANLQQQLEALARFRDELVAKGSSLSTGELEKSYSAVFSALEAQVGKVAERGAQVAEAEAARAKALTESLQDPELAAIIKEVKAFDAAAVQALPESYRAPVLAHHETQTAKLRSHFEKISPGPVEIDANELAVDAVFAVDAQEGQPELLIMVLPVSEATQTSWAARQEDVQTYIAARAVQAVYEACRGCGLPGAHALFGGHQGLLAIEAELVGASVDVEGKLLERLTAVFGSASELGAAGVKVSASKVPIDFLLPPEEEAGEEAVDEEVTHA